MAHPVAIVLGLSLAVWAADARLPALLAPSSPPADCQSGPSGVTPPGADVEVVVCGSRVAR